VTASVRSVSCTTSDGLMLEAELSTPSDVARASAVLCHPHPQAGGTMRSLVIGALFEALPLAGVTCLRFNFRGVEGSEGVHGDGIGELLDVQAAIGVLDGAVAPTLPLVLIGWSFGADLALATVVDRVAAWVAIAPPLRMARDFSAVATDARPKYVILGERDTVIDTPAVDATVSGWTNTHVETLSGASHYFVGRTDRLAELAITHVDTLVA
jgi:alpha/beta superfamily hydrolase